MSDYHQRFKDRFAEPSDSTKSGYEVGADIEVVLAFIDEIVREVKIKLIEDQEAGKIPYYNNVQSEKVRKAERAALIEKVEGMKKPCLCPPGGSACGVEDTNKALDDLLTYLRGEDNNSK